VIRRISGLSDRKDKRRVRDLPPLDRGQVVGAALDLLDEVGLDGLTMRRLAEKLSVTATALYRHVRSKEDLLELLAEEICTGAREPDPGLPWRKRLEVLAQENRRVLLAHRDAARIQAATVPAGPNRLKFAEIALRAVLEAGFSARDAAYAGALWNDYVTHSVAEEAIVTTIAEARRTDVEEMLSEIRSQFEALPQEEYPSMVALAEYMTEPDWEQRFQFGLEVLLDGLERRLTGSGPSGESSGRQADKT
jgi:TetR/AcrR family tetracycline transcriptional repressor